MYPDNLFPKSADPPRPGFNRLMSVCDTVTGLEEGFIIGSEVMSNVANSIRLFAGSDACVLITGETGVGKELVARAIHYMSARKSNPFVIVDCTNLESETFASEIFGHKKGSFTTAIEDRVGIIQSAHTGTIFFDEIAKLPVSLQIKLLRVMETGSVKRLGSNEYKQFNLRFVVASNQDLRKLVTEEGFAQDLYYRINVLRINIPPLRERQADILPIAIYFLNELSKRRISGKNLSLSPDALAQLYSYHWPGNIRELKQVIERSAILAQGSVIESVELDESGYGKDDTNPNLESKCDFFKHVENFEKILIKEALQSSEGNRHKTSYC